MTKEMFLKMVDVTVHLMENYTGDKTVVYDKWALLCKQAADHGITKREMAERLPRYTDRIEGAIPIPPLEHDSKCQQKV